MRYAMQQPANTVINFPAFHTNIYVQHQHLSSSIDSVLHACSTQTECWRYLKTKYWWTTQTHQLIAWDIHHQMLNKQPIKQHQQLIKYVYDWLPTGQVVHRHDRNEDHRCPHCRTVFEKN
jgi:hypothetical protein